MNTKIIAVIFALAFSANVGAVEKFSCEDLDGMASALDDLGVEFQKTNISEGDANDKALAEVIKNLHAVAAVENESDLNDNVVALENAWTNMNSDAFLGALADVIGSLDRLIKRDCS